MSKEVITTEDLWKEVAKIYTSLGNKLDELDRLLKKGVKTTQDVLQEKEE